MKHEDHSTKHGPIDPFQDWGFKYLFGREQNKDLLIGFLNLLLEPEVRLQDITYLNTELLADRAELRRCVVDVLCTDTAGDRYLVEMQNLAQADIGERLLYYACRLIDQMGQHRKEWKYGKIRKVYAICLMNFTYEPEPSLRNDFQLRDPTGEKLFSDRLSIITLQIPCLRARNASDFRKSYEILLYLLESMSKQMSTTEELLAEIDALDCVPEESKAIFRRVVTASFDMSKITMKEWREYEIERDYYLRTVGSLRDGREEGRKEGREEGRKEGREEGLAEGLARGRKEEKLEIARAMKENGVDAAFIAKCTGLSEEETGNL